MARSKEQWKAQQRAIHTLTQSKSVFQMNRPAPHQPGVRPMAPPASSVLFQLGRPMTRAPVAATVRPAVLKPDPIQTVSGSSSGQVIDLTLDNDGEDEDEPMGAQQPVTAAATAAAASSTASDKRKLAGTNNKAALMTLSLQQTEWSSDLMVPSAEDIESDVDEDWPAVPPSTSSTLTPPAISSVPQPVTSSAAQPVSMPTATFVNKAQASHSQTEEDVGAALDAIRKTTLFAQDILKGSDLERNTQVEASRQQASTSSLDGIDNAEMDMSKQLSNQAPKVGQEATGSPTTTDRIVRVENLEDGEIFEEIAPPKPTTQVQLPVLRDNPSGQFEVHPVGIRPHQRNKKQKKRGKKKNKRKLETMQMMHALSGEMLPEFERTTRQRPFADAPPPGQYTLAMMSNDPRGDSMNLRPLFQDPPPAPFRPVGLLMSGLHPSMRPSPQQRQTYPMPPPAPYDDSQILRVNRQGGMEMLDNEPEQPLPTMFSEPPMQGGFKYRSVSISPPRPVSGGLSHSLQRSVSEQARLPPIPPPSRRSMERDVSGDFDLDSLRAAALRSKAVRTLKTPTSTLATPTASEAQTSSSSSPSSPRGTCNEEKRSEPETPESESELRLKILRSMTRNRKRTASNAVNNVQVSTPVTVLDAVEKPSQSSDCVADENANGKPSAAQTDSNAAMGSSKPTLASDVAHTERIVNEESSCETDKPTTTSERKELSDKVESPSTSASGSAKPSVEPAVTIPEFRPLTACSQSLVIRLSPEDFSPHKSGDDVRAKVTASSSLQDAIKEMRRKIAEREKEQTKRLLENAAAKLSKRSWESSSASSSPTPPHQLCPGKKGSPTGAPVEVSDAKRAPDIVTTQVSRSEEKPIKSVSLAETLPPAETAARSESPETSTLELEERGDTSGDVSTSGVTDEVRPEKQYSVPTAEKAASTDAIPESSKDELDLDAIRVEYGQCVAECEEADMHIARLSNEMAQLERQLSPACRGV